MDVDISGISPNSPSGGDSSDGVSDEDTSDDGDTSSDENMSDGEDTPDDDDLGWISEDEDLLTSASDISSDDDSTLPHDEFDTTDEHDSDTKNNVPPSTLHAQVFDELKQMYAHRYEAPHHRLPKPIAPFLKHVLETLKNSRPDFFRAELRISPLAFDHLVGEIVDDPVFTSQSAHSHQAPVHEQLAVTLYRFGHNGNAASLQSVANWAGIGKGTVELYTHRVMTALLRPEFMRNSIRWPDEEEKEVAKEWVELHSCKAWRNGWCFVDGTLVPLVNWPYWYGESYFDRKCQYSLNIQVSFHPAVQM